MGGQGGHGDWEGEGDGGGQGQGEPQVLQAYWGGAVARRSYEGKNSAEMGTQGWLWCACEGYDGIWHRPYEEKSGSLTCFPGDQMCNMWCFLQLKIGKIV